MGDGIGSRARGLRACRKDCCGSGSHWPRCGIVGSANTATLILVVLRGRTQTYRNQIWM